MTPMISFLTALTSIGLLVEKETSPSGVGDDELSMTFATQGYCYECYFDWPYYEHYIGASLPWGYNGVFPNSAHGTHQWGWWTGLCNTHGTCQYVSRPTVDSLVERHVADHAQLLRAFQSRLGNRVQWDESRAAILVRDCVGNLVMRIDKPTPRTKSSRLSGVVASRPARLKPQFTEFLLAS